MKIVFHTFLFISLSLSNALAQNKQGTELRKAVFAGGCFWCMEPPYEAYYNKGVIKVTSGYIGGKKANPTYEEVSAGNSGHREAIEVVYDPTKLTYDKLLEIFWINIDPLDASGQFCDKGEQYQSAVYFNNDAERIQIEKSKKAKSDLLKKKGIVATKVLPASPFYPAEEYHQDYYIKNPVRYKFYRFNCGRDDRLKEVWSR